MLNSITKELQSISKELRRIADSAEYQDLYAIERDVKDRDSVRAINAKFARFLKVKGDIIKGNNNRVQDFDWDTSIYNAECADYLIKGKVYHNCTDACPADCDKNRDILPHLSGSRRNIMIPKEFKNDSK